MAAGVLDRFDLSGRVAVVTGASSGLGVAIAVGLAQAGADLVLGARRTEELERTADLVRSTGREVVTARTDVTSRADCDTLVAAGMQRFGRIDVLVNNAGIGGDYHEVSDDPPENFLATVDVNLNGSYWMLQACGPVMQPGSSVINMSSVMAVTTARMPAAGYAAAKSAVLGLTRDVAAQWGPRGIRVNALLPGVFMTEATANYSENYQRKIIDARIPIGRLGDPADVAATVVFLASDASSYITGVSLPIDGGVLLL